MRYDVIVAGAGPAGSTTARECAERGLSVVMVDRAEFPRDKPCGGGVNMRAAQLLPFDLAPVVERTIRGLRVSIRHGASYLRYADGPLTLMTQRRKLDAYLAEQAVQRGVTFHQRASVRELERHPNHVTVRAGGKHIEGRTLVLADGANGGLAKLAGIDVDLRRGIAFEGNITPRGDYPVDWRDTYGVDVGSCPGGYGWLFPKGDHVNIGVGGDWSMGPTVRERLDRLARYYGFEPADLWGVRGHPLPIRRPGARFHHGNVLLVGDAAGLVDPLTGEGIFSAIASGRAAAENLTRYLTGKAADLSGYQRDMERELAHDLYVSEQLHAIFHLAPPVAAFLVRRSSRLWRVVCGLLTGNTTYADVKGRHRWLTHGIDLGSAAGKRLAER